MPDNGDEERGYNVISLEQATEMFRRTRIEEREREERTTQNPNLIWARDVVPMLECDYLIKGVLDRRTLGLVYGPTSCGKTFFTLDLTLRIASDLPWRGRKTKRALVYYIAAEAGISLQRRVWAWKNANPTPRPPAFVIRPQGVPLIDDEKAVSRLIAELKALPAQGLPLCVVVDTVSRSMHGGDENRDLPALVSACDRLRDEANATVLLVHHTGKDASNGPRGHSSLPAAVDLSLSIQSTPTRAAVVNKARDAQTGLAFAFDLQVAECGLDVEGDMVRTCVVAHGEEGHVAPAERPERRGRELPDGAAEALRVLGPAISEHGEYRHGRRGIPFARWREAIDAQDAPLPPVGSDERDRELETRNRAFKRALLKLGNLGMVEILDGFVFFPN